MAEGLAGCLAGCFGGAFGEMEDGIGGRGFLFGGLVSGRDAEELLETDEIGVRTALELGAGEEGLGAVENAFGQGHLAGERAEHRVLEGILGDQVDDGDRARLVLAPGSGDALFEPGGIPGEVAVDNDAGVLEVQPHAAGIGAEEEAVVRIVAEGEDFAASLLLRDAAGLPGVADAVLVGPRPDFLQHAFPLGEDESV